MNEIQRNHTHRRKGPDWRLASRLGAVGSLAILLASCRSNLALDPMGPGAATIAGHWWVLCWTALAVCIIVLVLLAVAVLRARRRSIEPDSGSERRGQSLVIFGGGIVPLVILLGTTVFILVGLASFDDPVDEDALRIRITGHMFWWQIEYPDHGFETANELHIPVGEPVRIQLESADVIHSFWVPQLHGKLELVPGRTNELVIQADAPGSYLGVCAEFCGLQHANMRFSVIAQMPDDFDGWAEAQAEDASPPDTALASEGQEVFQRLICSNCHTVRGVSETASTVAPDLTHLSSRSTLAARTIPNTRSNLASWIMDPQLAKPGSNMPSTPMSGRELDALLEFLGAGQ